RSQGPGGWSSENCERERLEGRGGNDQEKVYRSRSHSRNQVIFGLGQDEWQHSRKGRLCSRIFRFCIRKRARVIQNRRGTSSKPVFSWRKTGRLPEHERRADRLSASRWRCVVFNRSGINGPRTV